MKNIGFSAIVVGGLATAALGFAGNAAAAAGDHTDSSINYSSSTAKGDFCRDINTVVNIMESPGPALSADQGDHVIDALESANHSSINVPPATTSAINAMLADMQAPTTSLPPSFSANATTLAQYAAGYCG